MVNYSVNMGSDCIFWIRSDTGPCVLVYLPTVYLLDTSDQGIRSFRVIFRMIRVSYCNFDPDSNMGATLWRYSRLDDTTLALKGVFKVQISYNQVLNKNEQMLF